MSRKDKGAGAPGAGAPPGPEAGSQLPGATGADASATPGDSTGPGPEGADQAGAGDEKDKEGEDAAATQAAPEPEPVNRPPEADRGPH